jgi:hypothetical protein
MGHLAHEAAPGIALRIQIGVAKSETGRHREILHRKFTNEGHGQAVPLHEAGDATKKPRAL